MVINHLQVPRKLWSLAQLEATEITDQGPVGGHGEAAPTATEATHTAQAPRVTQFRGPGDPVEGCVLEWEKAGDFLFKESMQLERFFLEEK